MGEIAFVNVLRWQRERKRSASEDAARAVWPRRWRSGCVSALPYPPRRRGHLTRCQFSCRSLQTTPCWRPQKRKISGVRGQSPCHHTRRRSRPCVLVNAERAAVRPAAIPSRATRRVATRQMSQAYPPQRGVRNLAGARMRGQSPSIANKRLLVICYRDTRHRSPKRSKFHGRELPVLENNRPQVRHSLQIYEALHSYRSAVNV